MIPGIHYEIVSIDEIDDRNQRTVSIRLCDSQKSMCGVISLDTRGRLHFVSRNPPHESVLTYVICESSDFENLTTGDILTLLTN